ncbi:MAG: SLC13 family permease, partial [Rhodospirillaceae bacterium]
MLAAAMLFLPAPAGSAPTAVPALALTFLVIGLMAAGAMPELHFAFLFFALALVFQIAPAEAVFSGFRAGAFWLVAGGIVLGMAAERTRLGTWVAAIFLRRADGTLAKAVAGLSIGAVVLGFLITAAWARVIILFRIFLALADRLGFPHGCRGRRAMLLSVVMISFFVPMAILPANFPNVLLSGMSDSLYGVDMTFGLYMLANFPIAGALKGLLVVGVILYWFRDRVRIADAPPPDRPPLSPAGRRLAVIVLATVTAWATDFWHGVSPGWVTITAAVICLMPVVGVLTPDDLKGRTSAFTAVFTVATVIGLGAVMAAAGAGDMIAHLLLDATDFGSGNAPYVYTVFSAINIAMMLFATIPGAITVM